jgi:uncharacterized phage protein (TIGR01671 family)
MSREIKFRVWDKDNKTFIYTTNDCCLCEEYCDLCFCIDKKDVKKIEKCYSLDLVLQQYTGLKDKNGKEIYEGDIVKCDPLWSNGLVFDDVVRFEQGMFGVTLKQHGNEQLKLTSMVVEIIGNIYETPNKFKKTK